MPFDYPGVFGASTDLAAPDFSGLIPSFTGGGSAPASPAVPATLGNIGDVVKRAPIMDYDAYKQSVGGLGGILTGLATGGPLGAIVEGFGLNDHKADYLKYLANALAVNGAAQKNELGQYDVDYYRRQNAGQPT